MSNSGDLVSVPKEKYLKMLKYKPDPVEMIMVCAKDYQEMSHSYEDSLKKKQERFNERIQILKGLTPFTSIGFGILGIFAAIKYCEKDSNSSLFTGLLGFSIVYLGIGYGLLRAISQ